jgi:hypothetical protein
VTGADPDRIEAVDPEVARSLRRLSGMERLRLAHELWDLTCDRLGAYFASLHPEWSPEEIQQNVARRMLDDPPMTFWRDPSGPASGNRRNRKERSDG